MGYWDFLRQNRRFLGFGFALSFFSVYGQTFYISLFGAGIRDEFGLTNAQFGAAYSAATLASAVTLVWLGRLIDRVHLTAFVVAICGGMFVSALALALAPNYAILTLAFFGLRLTGQGLMIHTALTSMARYFDAGRGKAVAIAQTGIPVSEAVLPSLAVALMALFGWRAAWSVASASVLLIALPLLLWLLRGQRQRHVAHLARIENAAANIGSHIRHWSRAEVLHDPRFYAILVPLTSLPFMGTALFFHQLLVATSKGWSLSWLAAMFVIFALSTVPSALVAGSIVDRFGAVRVFPFALFPFMTALVFLILFDGPLVAIPYMAFFGVAAGFQAPVANALITEIYGSTHLGAIRAMLGSVMVLASAPSPAIIGWAFDGGASVETIALWFLAYLAVAATVSFFVARHLPAPAPRLTADTS